MNELLLPADRRDKIFYLGSHEFDPKNVGVSATKIDGAFEFRTEQTGNSNAGHEFRNGPPGKGVLGPEFSDEERWAVIEYLKTL